MIDTLNTSPYSLVGIVVSTITILGAIYWVYNNLGVIPLNITIIIILSALYWFYNKHRKNKPKNILFINSEIQNFEIIKTLKKNKFIVDKLEDAKNLEDKKIKKAKIIFVDFKGISKKFGNQQGINLVKALKSKYKKKKTVILFSAHSEFSLLQDLPAGDDIINKNASTQDFIDMINKHL